MSRPSGSYVLAMSMYFGMLAIVIAALLLLYGCQSIESNETTTKFSPTSLTEPLTSRPSSQEARLPGSGSGYSTLSLVYIRRQLAINPSPTQLARLISDRGPGVSLLELTPGGELWI